MSKVTANGKGGPGESRPSRARIADVMTWRDLSMNARGMLVFLVGDANPDGSFGAKRDWPLGAPWLAKELGMSERHARRTRSELVEAGMLRKTGATKVGRGRGLADVFWLDGPALEVLRSLVLTAATRGRGTADARGRVSGSYREPPGTSQPLLVGNQLSASAKGEPNPSAKEVRAPVPVPPGVGAGTGVGASLTESDRHVIDRVRQHFAAGERVRAARRLETELGAARIQMEHVPQVCDVYEQQGRAAAQQMARHLGPKRRVMR